MGQFLAGRRRWLASTTLAVVVCGLLPAPAAAYTQDRWISANDVKQQTACWCVIASSLSWLNYISGATHPTQPNLSAEITVTGEPSSQGDKYAWALHELPCSDGSGTHGHDPRGMAWALYWHTPLGYYFNDYRYSSQGTADWELVYGVRGTSRPLGAIIKAGTHAILVTGYVTNKDPFTDGTTTLSSFYVFDPYTKTHSNVAIGTWNGSSWFTKNQSGYGGAGPFWAGYYIDVLQAYSHNPWDTPGQTYGDYAYSVYNGAMAAGPSSASIGDAAQPRALALATAGNSYSQPIARATVAAAIADGFNANDIDTGGLGVDLKGYQLGSVAHVDSLAPGASPYELVEIRVGSSVRAVAMVEDGSAGYTYAGASTLPLGLDVASPAVRADVVGRAGLQGDGRLVWAETDGSNLQFTPFIHAQDGNGADVYVDPLRGRQYRASDFHTIPTLSDEGN